MSSSVEVGNYEAVLETAQRDLEAAESALRTAENQLAELRAQADSLNEEIRVCDGDDVARLGELAQQRSTVLARIEAHETRVEARRKELAEARQRLEAAEVERDRVILPMKTSEAMALDEEFANEITATVKTLAGKGLVLGHLVRQCYALERRIRAADGYSVAPGHFQPSLDPIAVRHGNQMTYVLEKVEALWRKAEAEIRSERGAG